MSGLINAYIAPMVNQTDLQTNLVAPLKQLYLANTQYTWEEVLAHLTQVGGIKREIINDVANDLMSGKAVIYLAGNSMVYSFNTLRSIRRQPSEPLTERKVRGPRISLVEMLEDNLLMIHRGIKDAKISGNHRWPPYPDENSYGLSGECGQPQTGARGRAANPPTLSILANTFGHSIRRFGGGKNGRRFTRPCRLRLS